MPPIRTIPPAKAVKTERTHEENQERAYIAASRRSDRSLEARVESARRASEIHKRRTGRSLRVTEQDVINEEMYEEEDDDLPSQYRRLTAHLQTSNPQFNNRLAAYLTNNVAMRRALEQSIHDSYAQQFGAQGQQYQQQAMQNQNFPTPMMGQQQTQQHQFIYPPQSPNSFRSAPYPPRTPQQTFQPGHQRSASMANPQEMKQSSSMSPVLANDTRRMSVPAVPTARSSPVQTRTPSATPSSSGTPQMQSQPSWKPSFAPGSFQNFNQTGAAPQPDQSWDTNSNFPFSMAMPGNVQGLLGNTLDPSDPLTAQLMNGSGVLPGTFYDFSQQPNLPPTTNVGKQQMYPSFDGLTSTLAPSALGSTQPEQQQDCSSTYFADAWKAGSTELTPADGNNDAWSTYFDADAWDKPSSQPAK